MMYSERFHDKFVCVSARAISGRAIERRPEQREGFRGSEHSILRASHRIPRYLLHTMVPYMMWQKRPNPDTMAKET
jgi:hypothetical protein